MKKQSTMAFRAAAVLCSLSLASAFVAYRSGASSSRGRSAHLPVSGQPTMGDNLYKNASLDSLLNPAPPSTLGGSKSMVIFEPDDKPEPEGKPAAENTPDQQFISGSKSGRMIRPADVKPAPKPTDAAPATQPK